MFAKLFLIIVGLLYLALAIWCTVSPAVTSEKVGFELKGGSGQSEFMTVYGGLEFGLAILFLAAAFRPDALTLGLWSCVLVHASLVLFRSISLVRFREFETMTYQLAVGEWIILGLGLVAIWLQRKP